MVEITICKRPATEAVLTQRKFFKKTARGKVVKGAYTSSLTIDMAIFLTLELSSNKGALPPQ